MRRLYKDEELKCKNCGCNYFKKRRDSSTLDKCSSCMIIGRRRKKKAKAVAYKGGKCEKCGYDRCIAALVFHHRNPAEKEFEIGPNLDRKREELYKEIDKCTLLCHNCHTEEHEVPCSFSGRTAAL